VAATAGDDQGFERFARVKFFCGWRRDCQETEAGQGGA